MKYVPVFLLGLVISLQLTGCIILPLPPLGTQTGREDIETLEPGFSTREQVHEILGDPDVAITDHYEIFEVSEETLNLAVLTLFGPGFGPINERLYRVLAEYEPGGILRDLHWEARADVGGVIPGPDDLRYVSSDAKFGDMSWEEIPVAAPLPSMTWPNPLGEVTGVLTASPDGRLFAVSKPWSPPSIALHDGRTGALLAEIKGVAGCQPLADISPKWSALSTSALTAFLSDSRHLASISAEDTLCIWNANMQMQVFELSGGQLPWGVISARSAPIVAAVDADGAIGVWNGLSGSKIASVAPCESQRRCVGLKMSLSDDGQILATVQHRWEPNWAGVDVSQGSVVRLWDVRTGAELATLNLTKIPRDVLNFHNIALSPDLHRFVVNLGDHIEVWRIDKAPLPAHREKAPARTIVSSLDLERVLILPPTLFGTTFLHPKEVFPSVVFSADGRKLAAGYASAIVWEVGTWREIWRAPLGDRHEKSFSNGFIFTADGRRIISNCCFWEVPEPDDPQHSHAAATAITEFLLPSSPSKQGVAQ